MDSNNLVGQTVGNYEVKALLGEGGMGTVYLAEHAFMGWRAAIKVLRRSLADDQVLVKRFINEARAVKAVRHDSIIEIIDVGILADGLPYLLMELLEGDSLGARLRKCGRLSVAQAIDITCQTAAALGAVHDQGIVHRDLKPDNLFLLPRAEDPSRERVKVLDFGIAKLRGSGAPGSHSGTLSGALLGTPTYMSPEQCRGIASDIDHRTDIYALSIMLHEMLTGEAPFVSAGTGDVLVMHLSMDPPGVRLQNPEVPPSVEAAILRGLAKQREHRFQSMAELAAALVAGLPEPLPLPRPLPEDPPAWPARTTAPLTPVTTLSVPVPTTRLSGRPSRRSWAVNLALLLAVPLLVLIAYRASSSGPTPGREPSVARAPAARSAAASAPAVPPRSPAVAPPAPEAPAAPAREKVLTTRKAERAPAPGLGRSSEPRAAVASPPARARGVQGGPDRSPGEPRVKALPPPPASESRPPPRRRARPWL